MHRFHQISGGFGTAKRDIISNLKNLEGPFYIDIIDINIDIMFQVYMTLKQPKRFGKLF